MSSFCAALIASFGMNKPGFGVEQPRPSWGNMLAFSFSDTANPWAWLAPALCLWLTLQIRLLDKTGPEAPPS